MAAKPKAKKKEERKMVEVRSFGSPTYRGRLDAEKYNAMKKAVLKVTPRKAPGITQAEMFKGVRPLVSKSQFPGTTHMWWSKGVQLDLEARGVLRRDPKAKPLRWTRVK